MRCYVWLAVAISFLGCSGEGCSGKEVEPSRVLTHDGGPAVCDGSVVAPSARIEPSLHTLGPSSNVVRTYKDWVWVVESGSNTVSRVNWKTGAFDSGFIDVGNGRGPWDLWFDAGLVFVSNLTSGTVTVADAATGEVVRELEGTPKASGIAVTDTHLYVTNTNHNSNKDEDEFGPGSVTVIERDGWTVVGEISTAAKNPVNAAIVPETGQIMIVSAGALVATKLGDRVGFAPVTDGAVEIWTPGPDALSPEREVFTLPQTDGSRMGAPGAPIWAGRYVYFVSVTAPVLFKLDLEESAWVHGVENPIVMYVSDKDTLHHAAIDDRGVVYVTSFNDDRMYLLDTACDKMLGVPVELGVVPDLLEGPHGAVARVVDENRTEVHFITSISGVVGRVMFDFEETP